ncbi:MAG: hypothetical protein LBP74_10770 [Treponema sp.]|jgi:hypothetical protein|nr:hypothetical protein [Treponema sp.]
MQYWLDYDEEYFRRTYRERKASETSKPNFNRQDLYDLGYTDEEIDNEPALRGE